MTFLPRTLRVPFLIYFGAILSCQIQAIEEVYPTVTLPLLATHPRTCDEAVRIYFHREISHENLLEEFHRLYQRVFLTMGDPSAPRLVAPAGPTSLPILIQIQNKITELNQTKETEPLQGEASDSNTYAGRFAWIQYFKFWEYFTFSPTIELNPSPSDKESQNLHSLKFLSL